MKEGGRSFLKNIKQYVLFKFKKNNIDKDVIQEYTYDQLKNIIDKFNDNPIAEISLEVSLLSNILHLREQRVEDIMVPRVDIVSIEEGSPIEDVIREVKKSGFSRIPVFKDTLDNILGFVHCKDLITTTKNNKTVSNGLIRSIIYISPYMKILDLLLEMRTRRTHLAVVVDEFGGVDGLVTIEDLVEAVVGEISDEHDKVSYLFLNKITEGILESDARTEISRIEEVTGEFASEEEREEADTIGGLVASICGYIPSKNELVTHPSGVVFKILAADSVKVKKVHIDYKALSNEELI